jgi:hypothetical protein
VRGVDRIDTIGIRTQAQSLPIVLSGAGVSLKCWCGAGLGPQSVRALAVAKLIQWVSFANRFLF